MIKADIVKEINKSTGVDSATIAEVIEAFAECIKDALIAKDNVYMRGFGTFEYRVQKQKIARDIHKDKLVVVPAHGVVKFKPCIELKNAVK